MSSRHRSTDTAPAPRAELRAHARGERHRINTELHSVTHQVSSGLEPDDADEPGAAWKAVHHHDSEKAKALVAKRRRGLRHWKVKAWKRRTAQRQARAEAFRLTMENA